MAQRRQDQRPGRLDPADDFDHEIDVLSGDQCLGVGGEQLGIDAWAVSVVIGAPRCRPAPMAGPPGRADRLPAR